MPATKLDVEEPSGRKQHGPNEPVAKEVSTFPTTLSDLTFHSSIDPASYGNIYKTLSALRKSTLSIPNRILSVLQDAEFIEALHHNLKQLCGPDILLQHSSSNPDQKLAKVSASEVNENAAEWPLVPNERSGSWPLPPRLKMKSQRSYLSSSPGQPHPQPVSAYFKSTDGHVNQWAFSTRRLNLPVLEILGSAGEAILIDTTRRGKAYPDALRRTVPIFTSVWNRTLFSDLEGSGVNDFQGFGLEKGEVSQIEARLPRFVQDLKSLGLPLEDIRLTLKRPVRCLWVHQPASRREWDTVFEDLAQQIDTERKRWNQIGGMNILICCSASRQVLGAEMSDDGYIQGAGDDSEGWSKGLTAKVFWDNKDELMKSVEVSKDIENLVKSLVKCENQREVAGSAILIQPTTNMFLSKRIQEVGSFDLVIDCNSTQQQDNKRVLGLGCREGKLGSKMLRDSLPNVETAVQQQLQKSLDSRILVKCSTGRDLSVGVMLTILCRFYSNAGERFNLNVFEWFLTCCQEMSSSQYLRPLTNNWSNSAWHG